MKALVFDVDVNEIVQAIPWRPTEQIIERFRDIAGAAEVLPPVEGVPALPMLHGTRGVRVIYNTVGDFRH